MKNGNENKAIKNRSHSRGMLSGIYNDCCYDTAKSGITIKKVILNLIQDLTLGIKAVRFQIKFAMTSLVNNRGCTTARSVTPQGRYAGYSGRTGFTLIELLVVVLIIGILAAVALPQYQKAVYRSRYANLKTLAASIAQAEEVYYLANGQYATKLDDLDIDLPGDKTNESTDTRYVYDEGWSCSIDVGRSAQAECFNYKIDMGYQQRFNYSSHANRRVCVVDKTTDITDMRNEICKAETGAPNGTVNETYNVVTWVYQ